MEPGLEWRAIEWRDGAAYDGLVKDRRLHSHGVLRFPNKDRYEGQFTNGLFDGYGVYVWADGTVYRGEWMQGEMHGCGIKLWRVANDDSTPGTSAARPPSLAPAPAAPAAKNASASSPSPTIVVRAAEGRFARDFFAGPGLTPCDDPQSALDAAVEADYAAAQARSFAERRRQLVSSGVGRAATATVTPLVAGRPPLGRPQEQRHKGGAGWLGGLFGGGGRAQTHGVPQAASSSGGRAAIGSAASGPGGAYANMRPGERELLSALVDRVVEHEVALAMADQEFGGAAAASAAASAAGGGGERSRGGGHR